MPPPVTPSPHRFINKPKSQRPPNPPSSLQRQVPPPPPAASSSQQFKPTPRFSAFSAPKREEQPAAAAPSSPLVARGKRPTQVSSHSEAFQPQHDAKSTTKEAAKQTLPTPEAEHANRPSHRKRRRLSSSSDFPPFPTLNPNTIYISDDNDNNEASASQSASSSRTDSPPPSPPRLPPLKLPPTQTHQTHPNRPSTPATFQPPRRFLLSTPHPTTQNTPSSPPPPSKPTFLLPPNPTTNTATQDPPLPESFSPHRRGQKYVPGGLAAQVRDWVMQTSQTSLHQRRLEEFAVRVLVEEVRRVRGIVLVRGMVGGSEPLRGIVDGEGELKRGMFSGKEKKIILAEGERGGIVGEEVRKGNLIGIRAPVWEVDVLGESWGFGVQWQVIDS